jgi:hypothetical protein
LNCHRLQRVDQSIISDGFVWLLGNTGLAIAIVGLPLKRITQHLVGLSESLQKIHPRKTQLVRRSKLNLIQKTIQERNQVELSSRNNLEFLGGLRIIGVLVRMHLPRLNIKKRKNPKSAPKEEQA